MALLEESNRSLSMSCLLTRNRFLCTTGMGDWSGFVDKLQDVVPKNQQPELLEKLSQGTFTLRIMYDQFQNILNMGPLKEVRESLVKLLLCLRAQGWLSDISIA